MYAGTLLERFIQAVFQSHQIVACNQISLFLYTLMQCNCMIVRLLSVLLRLLHTLMHNSKYVFVY